MKKIISIAIVFNILTIRAYSQQKLDQSAVPATVKTSFSSMYPHSQVEYWVKEEGNYAAEFDSEKKEMVLILRPDGKVVKLETRIHPSGLPAAAKDYIAKHYPGKKVTDCVTTSDPEGHRIYEAEVNERDLIFDSNGNFIKSVKERPVD